MAYWLNENGFGYYSEPGGQDSPAMVQLTSGREFVAWVDSSGGAPTIVGRGLDSGGGSPTPDVMLAGPMQAGSASTVRLVATPDGGFDAFWEDATAPNKLTGTSGSLIGRHFDAAGTPLGAAFAVGPAGQHNPDFNFKAVMLGSGDVLVTWLGAAPTYQVVTPDGAPVTDVRTINPLVQPGDDFAHTFAITPSADGGFYGAWNLTGADGVDHAYFEKFDASGNAVGGPHLAMNFGAITQTKVAELADGNVVVTCIYYDGQYGIFGGEFTPDGHVAGSRAEQIGVPAGQVSYTHDVAALPDGGFVITWTQQTPGQYDGKLFMHRYDSGFVPVDQALGDFVGDTGAASQYSSIVRADGAPAYAWTWSNATDPGDIHIKTYTNVPVPGATINGTAAGDALSGTSGDDVVDGGAGIDTFSYANVRSHYSISRTADAVTVLGYDGNYMQTDSLRNVERLHFSDVNVALDVNGNAGEAYRLYQAAFDRRPDLGGLGFWINGLDHGQALVDVSNDFVSSAEFSTKYGALDNTQFVDQLYKNVLHRGPDSAGEAYWAGHLDQGDLTRAGTLVYFSESAENQAALVGVMENGMEYTPQ